MMSISIIKFCKCCKHKSKLLFKYNVLRRIVIPILFVSIQSYVCATNYYFAANGDDLKNNGLSIHSPWRSTDKLNAIMTLLNPGDSVLFHRGDQFDGETRITKSGTKQSVIYFGAYGKGSKPVLNGTTRISAWGKGVSINGRRHAM